MVKVIAHSVGLGMSLYFSSLAERLGLENEDLAALPISVTIALAILTVLLVQFFSEPKSDEDSESGGENQAPEESGGKKARGTGRKLLLATLKGHSEVCTSVHFSADDRFIITSSEDKSIRLWYRDSLKEKNAKYHKITTDADYPGLLTVGGKLVVAYMAESMRIVVYGLKKSGIEKTKEFESSGGQPVKFLLSNQNDTHFAVVPVESSEIYVHSAKGDLIEVLDNKQEIISTAMSGDGRYIAACGASKTIKIWETSASSGSVEMSRPLAEIKNLSSPAVDICFSQGSTLGAVTKDGSVKLWLLSSKGHKQVLDETPEFFGNGPAEILRISPNSDLFILVRGSSFRLYASDGTLAHAVDNAHHGTIVSASWSSDSSCLCTTGDRNIRTWDIARIRSSA